MTGEANDEGPAPVGQRARDRLGRPVDPGSADFTAPLIPSLHSPAATIEAAAQLLASGLSFYAHEVFEEAWKAADESDRLLWRGLAQLAVAMTHAARGNRTGADRLLERGLSTLLSSAAGRTDSYGVDLDAVTRWVSGSRARVEAGVPVELAPFPLPQNGG